MTATSAIAHSALHQAAALMLAGHVFSAFSAPCMGHNKAALPQILARLERGERMVIACLGDSVTGVYYHTGGRQAYPEMIAAALHSRYPCANLQVVNGGVSGHTSLDGVARLRQDILPRHPHLVTIMFGLNDMVLVELAAFQSMLELMVDECRAADADVLLCTPNAVEDTPSRPRELLVKYVAAIRAVGQAKNVPVADVFAVHEAIRRCDSAEFSLLMSDPFHPNADGHELIARTICKTLGISNSVDLYVRLPSSPASHIAKLLAAGEQVQLLATPPFDTMVVRAIRRIHPDAKLKITPWRAAEGRLSDIANDVRQVRELRPDLVVFAIRMEHCAGDAAQFARAYREILNGLFSFERREWDLLVLPPSVCEPGLSADQLHYDALVRRLIHAQDLPLIVRTQEDRRSPLDLLTDWLREHLNEKACL